MKKQFTAMIAGGAALWALGAQATIVLNFASVPGSTMQFNGSQDTFQFNVTTSPAFPQYNGVGLHILSENAGNASIGDKGSFSISGNKAATWSYGPITQYGGGLQRATVTSPAGTELVISDGSGGTLTAPLNWGLIQTAIGNGADNATLTLNLGTLVNPITYTGASDSDFTTLANEKVASLILTFSFAPGMTLQQLSSGVHAYKSSYSGSITDQNVPPPPPPVVPEAATSIAGGAALGIVALLMALQRRRGESIKISK